MKLKGAIIKWKEAQPLRRVLRRAWPGVCNVLNHPFGLTGAAYVAVVLSCAVVLGSERTGELNYLAVVELKHNHRIASRDLRRPSSLASSLGFYMPAVSLLEGKYVSPSRSIMPGQPVPLAALAKSPDMSAPGLQLLSVPPAGDFQSLAMLDAGMPVLLAGLDSESKPILISAAVHAIVCNPAKAGTDDCYPVLAIAVDQRQLALTNLSKLKLLLRPN
jgi:hypothetical protein